MSDNTLITQIPCVAPPLCCFLCHVTQRHTSVGWYRFESADVVKDLCPNCLGNVAAFTLFTPPVRQHMRIRRQVHCPDAGSVSLPWFG
jgi:hypothetical protein